jgi:pimeloyl-[acyl-carrier protein] methyl ester esterase
LKLLFIHGWATNSSVWKYQVEEFSKEHRVVTIDLPGHTEKDVWSEPTLKPAVEKLLRIMHHAPRTTKSPLPPFYKGGNRGIIGIGWSLGGQVILEAAVKNPDAFKALVLIGTAPKFVADETFPYGQPQGVAKRMLKDIKKDFSKTMQRFYPLNFTEEELLSPAAKEFMELYQKKNTKLSQGSTITSLGALLSVDLRDILSKIAIPALIIHGEKDQVCPVEAARYLAENLPDAKLEIFKDAGHAPFLTKGKEFNEAVKEFLYHTVKLPSLGGRGKEGGGSL